MENAFPFSLIWFTWLLKSVCRRTVPESLFQNSSLKISFLMKVKKVKGVHGHPPALSADPFL
jgi:hypothetical protein